MLARVIAFGALGGAAEYAFTIAARRPKVPSPWLLPLHGLAAPHVPPAEDPIARGQPVPGRLRVAREHVEHVRRGPSVGEAERRSSPRAARAAPVVDDPGLAARRPPLDVVEGERVGRGREQLARDGVAAFGQSGSEIPALRQPPHGLRRGRVPAAQGIQVRADARLRRVPARGIERSATGPCPKHGPHHDARISAPAERNTEAIDSPPSRGSERSMSFFTSPDPGKTTNPRGALSRPFARAARMTSAASSRSS